MFKDLKESLKIVAGIIAAFIGFFLISRGSSRRSEKLIDKSSSDNDKLSGSNDHIKEEISVNDIEVSNSDNKINKIKKDIANLEDEEIKDESLESFFNKRGIWYELSPKD